MLFYGGEENVPGAPGVRYKTNSGTGAPVAFNPNSQLQIAVMAADPMNQMGNAGYFNQMQAAGGPALPGEPGRDPIPTAPGGRPHLPGEKPTPAPAGRNPQLPGMKLAQVDYTSPHPKFDQHMKKTPPLSQPKDRIDHLKKGVTIRKA